MIIRILSIFQQFSSIHRDHERKLSDQFTRLERVWWRKCLKVVTLHNLNSKFLLNAIEIMFKRKCSTPFHLNHETLLKSDEKHFLKF